MHFGMLGTSISDKRAFSVICSSTFLWNVAFCL